MDASATEGRAQRNIALIAVDAECHRTELAIGTPARRDDPGRKLHRPFRRLLHFLEARVVLVAGGDHRGKLRGLLLRKVADAVQRINTEVHHWTTATILLRLPPPKYLRLKHTSAERLHLPERSGT